MISNLILQDTINGIKDITKAELSVFELDGKAIVSTGDDRGIKKSDIVSFVESKAEFQEIGDSCYFKVYDELQLTYVLVVTSQDKDASMVGKMAALQLKSLLIAYKEHFDKDNFIKNLLLDNLLIVDIYSRAKKLHIEPVARRVVYIVENVEGDDYIPVDDIKNYYSASGNDFITAVDEKSVIIVKELGEGDLKKELEKTGKEILKLVDKEGKGTMKIAYGNVVSEIKEVSRSYKEARMALDVGKIFFEDKSVVAYNRLGIGRLIYQLPLPLCKMFIREIFANKSIEDFDEATITTINKFFENSLNVSETSRQLYIHRNTLVYRLDKLEKSTGLDLRVFDDAITFKIALMVVRYMKYMEKLDY